MSKGIMTTALASGSTPFPPRGACSWSWGQNWSRRDGWSRYWSASSLAPGDWSWSQSWASGEGWSQSWSLGFSSSLF
jgi:hypothetical protein